MRGKQGNLLNKTGRLIWSEKIQKDQIKFNQLKNKVSLTRSQSWNLMLVVIKSVSVRNESARKKLTTTKENQSQELIMNDFQNFVLTFV
jgi:hypothetical protein